MNTEGGIFSEDVVGFEQVISPDEWVGLVGIMAVLGKWDVMQGIYKGLDHSDPDYHDVAQYMSLDQASYNDILATS